MLSPVLQPVCVLSSQTVGVYKDPVLLQSATGGGGRWRRMCWIRLGEPCPRDREKCLHFLPFRNVMVFFPFPSELYESQQKRDLPKAVTPGGFVLLSIRRGLAVDSTLNY